jgi:hypothetical protein
VTSNERESGSNAASVRQNPGGADSVARRRPEGSAASDGAGGGDSGDHGRRGYEGGSGGGTLAAASTGGSKVVSDTSVRLTPSAATAYQEWPVVKTNQRGRRQQRLLGIDLTRITNKKVEKPRFLSSDKTSNAERLIADIWLIEVMDSDPKSFAITFKVEGSDGGGAELTRILYEAALTTDRDSIIAKLAYILGMNGDRHKLRRAA